MVLKEPKLAKTRLRLDTIFTKNCANVIINGKLTTKFIATPKSKITNISENNGKAIKLEIIVTGANSPKYLQTKGIVPIVEEMVIDIDEDKNFGNLILSNNF